jgi:hypothetical protein
VTAAGNDYLIGGGDLRLRLDSPALDSCDAAYAPAYRPDYELDDSGYDLASKPDIRGPYDRGADEIRPLFADGFETGGTLDWL